MAHCGAAGWCGLVALATMAASSADAAGADSPIRRVVEERGSGSFHCAWHRRTVRGLCKVSHDRVATRDPGFVAMSEGGKSPATIDVIVIRWPSGKVSRLTEGDDWEWQDLGDPELAYHGAYHWDGKDVDWSRGFVILDDRWKEAIRVW